MTQNVLRTEFGFHLLHWAYICTDWTNCQEHFDPGKEHTWTQNLIAFLCTESAALWKQRNDELHAQENTRHLINLQSAATKLHNLQDHTLTQDHHSFDILFNEWLNHFPRTSPRHPAWDRPTPPPSHIQHAQDHLLLHTQNINLT
jgi:hypothetical protein